MSTQNHSLTTLAFLSFFLGQVLGPAAPAEAAPTVKTQRPASIVRNRIIRLDRGYSVKISKSGRTAQIYHQGRLLRRAKVYDLRSLVGALATLGDRQAERALRAGKIRLPTSTASSVENGLILQPLTHAFALVLHGTERQGYSGITSTIMAGGKSPIRNVAAGEALGVKLMANELERGIAQTLRAGVVFTPPNTAYGSKLSFRLAVMGRE